VGGLYKDARAAGFRPLRTGDPVGATHQGYPMEYIWHNISRPGFRRPKHGSPLRGMTASDGVIMVGAGETPRWGVSTGMPRRQQGRPDEGAWRKDINTIWVIQVQRRRPGGGFIQGCQSSRFWTGGRGRPDEGARRKDINTIWVIQVSARQRMGRPYAG